MIDPGDSAAETPLQASSIDPEGGERSASLVGSKIGRIHITEALARGGMGEVYIGFDEKLGRKVAVKTLHTRYRLDGKGKVRFLREARVLSALHHPKICQIYDYIEGDDCDILVLELIEGRSLREAIKAGLRRTEKESIAEDLLSALEVAHERGIIHRDLKPSNVMLTPEGDVKVLDFGLARTVQKVRPDGGRSQATKPTETEAERGDRDVDSDRATVDASSHPSQEEILTRIDMVETRAGTVVGTPGYMSPEQVRGETLTTASDIFSAGLLLQELFTGERPYDSRQGITEHLVQAERGEYRPVRGLSPDLTDLIDRMKAAQPGARPSATDALARFRWIRAGPRRRRRRRLLYAAVAVLFAVTLLLAYQALRISREAERANREAISAQRVSALLEDVFLASDPSESPEGAVATRVLVDQSAERILGEPSIEPEIRVRLLSTIAAVYRSLGLYDRAAELLEEGLRWAETLDPRESPGLGQIHFEAGLVARFRGDLDKAYRHHERSLAIREQQLGRTHPDTVDSLQGVAYVHSLRGDLAEARALLEEALVTLRDSPPDSRLTQILHGLGQLELEMEAAGHDEADPARGETLLREALELRRDLLGSKHLEVAYIEHTLGTWLHRGGRSAEAESLLRDALEIKRQTLGSQHLSFANTARSLAGVLLDTGRATDALELARGALEVSRDALPDGHWRIGNSESVLGSCLVATGDPREGELLMRRGLATLRRERGDADLMTREAASRLQRHLADSELEPAAARATP